MKRFSILLIAMVMVLSLSNPCFAVKKAQWKTLVDSSGTIDFDDYAISQDASIYSESIPFSFNVGSEAVLLLTEDKAGGAGDVDVSVEYCIDGCTVNANWHNAWTASMDGTITQQGNLITTASNSVSFISYPVKTAPYMRYKFEPDADSQVSAKTIIQIEN